MGKKFRKNLLTLYALDIEGAWNIPLLRNAAEISGALLEFLRGDLPVNPAVTSKSSWTSIGKLLDHYDNILACETVKNSRNIYKFPAPRGRTAVFVGNELAGIPKNVLKKVDQTVSIPILGKGMTSVNVAVAAAIALYALERDLVRNGIHSSTLRQQNVDILLQGAKNPSELGSLLRSIWAFGWRKVYLSDLQSVWFTDDLETVRAGRAAARREINPIVVAPREHLNTSKYSKMILCNSERSGTALSRLVFPKHGKILIVFGDGEPPSPSVACIEQVFIDHKNSKSEALFRHAGSILFSVISQMLRTHD